MIRSISILKSIYKYKWNILTTNKKEKILDFIEI